MTRTVKLRPASLVLVRSSIEGAVSYARKTLTPETLTPEGALVSSWETDKKVSDAEAYAEAIRVRAAIRNGISGACAVTSAFGLMCPAEKIPALDAAIKVAEERAEAFNSAMRQRGSRCRVWCAVIRGEVSSSDEEAARAVSREIASMVREMREGIRAASPARIRKAADEARALASVLSDSDRNATSAAIAEARSAARTIARRVSKAGEVAAVVLSEIETSKLDSARWTFLDLGAEIIAPESAPSFAPDAPILGTPEIPAASFAPGPDFIGPIAPAGSFATEAAAPRAARLDF